jgi:hypothetical protein
MRAAYWLSCLAELFGEAACWPKVDLKRRYRELCFGPLSDCLKRSGSAPFIDGNTKSAALGFACQTADAGRSLEDVCFR